MTSPIGEKIEYPTLVVPPTITKELPTAISVEKSSTEPEKMANENMNAQQQGWFTSFTTGGQSPNSGEAGQTPSTFNTQTAISWLGQRYRHWSEFFNTKKFGLPKLDGVVQRIQHNLNHFLGNYLCISIVLLVYCIVTSFVLLLALIALAGLIYSIRQKTLKGPIVFAGSELPPSLLYSLAIIVVIPLFYLADTSGVIGWVVGTSIFMIILHAALYSSEEVPGSEFEVVTIA